MEGRFYEAEFPAADDVVVVQVKKIVTLGVYAALLEYDGREGMMPSAELSKYNLQPMPLKPAAKLVRVGQKQLCKVIRVDTDKGYIDLSKRRVDPEVAAAKEEAYARAKIVHGIMRHVAAINDIGVEELCKKVSWPLHKQHGDAHDALQRHINNDINLWEEIDFSQPGKDLTRKADKLRAGIDLHAKRRLLPQIIRLRTKIEVTCFEDEGVDAVRDSLLRGLEASTPDCTLNISLVAHPLFALSCTCRDRTLGKETMERAMDLIRSAIQAKGGSFDIESLPVLMGNEQDPRLEFVPPSSASVTSNGSTTECDQQYESAYLVGHDRGASFEHNEFFSERDLEESARIQ